MGFFGFVKKGVQAVGRVTRKLVDTGKKVIQKVGQKVVDFL